MNRSEFATEETIYEKIHKILPELEHEFGPNVHLLSQTVALTLLAQLGAPETDYPKALSLLRFLYLQIVNIALGKEFPSSLQEIPTRMKDKHPDLGSFRGELLDPSVSVVVVNVARAGIVPAQVCFEFLAQILDPSKVRMDVLLLGRQGTSSAGHDGPSMTIEHMGAKIGGSIQDSIVIVPDPMGATGSTVAEIIEIYRSYGNPRRWVFLPLIVTPEFLHKVTQLALDNYSIYSFRYDRGLSDSGVFQLLPGSLRDPSRERGLDENNYIVPGAGGLGELFTNSYV